MSQRVPSCDELDQSASYNCFATPTYSNIMFNGSKSRTWYQDSRTQLADQFLPAVPEYDQVAELTWKNGHPAMQELGGRPPNRQKFNCYSSSSAAWGNDHDHDQPGMVLTRRTQNTSDKEVEGTLDAIVARTMQNLPTIDEEMASWFQSAAETELQENPSQKTEKNPDVLAQSIPSESSPTNLVSPSSQSQSSNDNSNIESMNFSLFSKPAVLMKTQLQTLGSASGPTNIQRVRQYGGEAEVVVSNPIPPRLCTSNSEFSTHVNTLASKNYPPPQSARKYLRPIMPSASATAATTTTAHTQTVTSDYDAVRKVVEVQSGTSATFGTEITTSDLNCDAMEMTLVSNSGGSPGISMTQRSGKEPRWKRKRDQDSACQSEDQDDDQSAQAKKSQTGRRSNSSKRTRAAAVHNQSERRRRDRINERMKALQKLIPNSSKTDKASMLDEAIEYLKHLQAQLQMMCLRNGMNIPPMMLPLGMQQLQMSLLSSLGPMGLGMGMAGMSYGIGMGMMDLNPVATTGRAALVPMGQPLPGTGSHALPVAVHPVNFIQPNFTAAAAAGFPAVPAPVPTPVLAHDANERLKNAAVVDSYNAFMACQRQSMNMDLYNSMALLQHQQLHHHQQQQLQLPMASQHPHQQQQQQHQISNSK